jgi:phage-related protein
MNGRGENGGAQRWYKGQNRHMRNSFHQRARFNILLTATSNLGKVYLARYSGGDMKKIYARFYKTAGGIEPAREFVKELSLEDKRTIGADIATVEFGWPVGMPTCRSLSHGLWEVRSNISGKRIARIIFCIANGDMVLLHGFIKKTQTTPKLDMDLAKARKKELEK